MNRVEFVASIAERAGLKKVDADKAVSAFLEVVTEELSKGEEIRLLGFGNFCIAHRNATEGRNLKTGEIIKIPAKNLPKFKPGKNLKEAVANGK